MSHGRNPNIFTTPFIACVAMVRTITPLFVVTLLLLCSSGSTRASDKANRTLFGVRAVQKELNLTSEQQEKIDALITKMEAEIETQLKELDQKKSDAAEAETMAHRDEIVNSSVAKYGPLMHAVLDPDQVKRIWQIGAQSAGGEVFNNAQVRKALKIKRDQLIKMAELSDAVANKLTPIVTSKSKSPEEIESEVERQNKDLFQAMLGVLTPEQRTQFDDLMGKPFDIELLKVKHTAESTPSDTSKK